MDLLLEVLLCATVVLLVLNRLQARVVRESGETLRYVKNELKRQNRLLLAKSARLRQSAARLRKARGQESYNAQVRMAIAVIAELRDPVQRRSPEDVKRAAYDFVRRAGPTRRRDRRGRQQLPMVARIVLRRANQMTDEPTPRRDLLGRWTRSETTAGGRVLYGTRAENLRRLRAGRFSAYASDLTDELLS